MASFYDTPFYFPPQTPPLFLQRIEDTTPPKETLHNRIDRAAEQALQGNSNEDSLLLFPDDTSLLNEMLEYDKTNSIDC